MSNEGFSPTAVLLTELEVPSPLFVAALTGSSRQKLIPLDISQSPLTWPRLVTEEIRQRRARGKGSIPGFGLITGFIINFRSDHAVRFTTQGNPVETLPAAVMIGSAELSISDRILARDGRSPIFRNDDG